MKTTKKIESFLSCLFQTCSPTRDFFLLSFKSLALVSVVTMWSGCPSEGGANKNLATTDTPHIVTDGGVFSPTEGSQSLPPPVESCTPPAVLSVTPRSISFPLNELTYETCQEVVTSPCVTFSAEIDRTTDKYTSSKEPAFVLRTSDDADTTDRLSGLSKSVKVCYTRQEVGSHTGQLNIVFNEGMATMYAVTVPLKGSTSAPLYNDLKPKNGQTFCEYSSACDFTDSSVKDGKTFYTVPFSGTISGAMMSQITTPAVEVSVSGTKQSADFTKTTDGSDSAFGGDLTLKSDAAVYPVDFKVPTTDGDVTREINLVRYTAPTVDLQVRDAVGNLVNSLVATDGTVTDASRSNSPQLMLGVHVDNLSVSAPSLIDDEGILHQKRLDVTVTLKSEETGKYKYYNISNNTWSDWVNTPPLTLPFQFYNGFVSIGEDGQSIPGLKGACGVGFTSPSDTYCISLPVTGELALGENTIKVSISTPYLRANGTNSLVSTTTVLVGNDVPIIKITSPIENQVYAVDLLGSDKDVIYLEGTIENFVEKVTLYDDDGKPYQQCATELLLNTAKMESETRPQPLYLCSDVKNADGTSVLTILENTDSNSKSANFGNVRKAKFKIKLPETPHADGDFCGKYNLDRSSDNTLTCFTNILLIQAQNSLGHIAYGVRSFQRGDYVKTSVKNQTSGSDTIETTLGNLSNVSDLSTQKTIKAPFMLNLSESSLTDPSVITVIEKFLNDNVKFADVVQGGALPGDTNGNNFEDLDERINMDEAAGLDIDKISEFDNLTQNEKKSFVWYNLHGSMPQKVRAMKRYRMMYNSDEVSDGHFVFPDQCTDQQDSTQDPESKWDLACDSCRNRITTALVSYDTYPYIFDNISFDLSVSDQSKMKTFAKDQDDWPKMFGDDLDFIRKDIVQGKWKVGKIDLKSDGYIDVEVCIIGEGMRDCNDKIENATAPAFWGHMAAWPLAETGITGLSEDPEIPLLWNVGKLTLSFKDALRLTKGSNGKNKIIFSKAKMTNSVQLEPFLGCNAYYKEKYYEHACSERAEESIAEGDDSLWTSSKDGLGNVSFDCAKALKVYPGQTFNYPYGCGADDGQVYPVVMDINSVAGYAAALQTTQAEMNGSTEKSLIDIINTELPPTFVNIISCMADEKINPILGSMEYPKWVDTKDQITTAYSLDRDNNGGLSVVKTSEAKDPVVSFNADVSHADINISDDSLSLKLPFSTTLTVDGGVSEDNRTDVTVRGNGYVTRMPDPSNKDTLESLQNIAIPDNSNEPFGGMSIGVEDLANASLHLLMKKGPHELLKLAGKDLADDLTDGGDTIIVDRVTLSRLGLCGGLSGNLTNTYLPPGVLFAGMSTFLPADAKGSHLEITFDKNSPPTVTSIPVRALSDGKLTDDPNATILQIGLTNLQISLKGLKENEGEAGTSSTYEVLEPELAKMRVDGLLRILVYSDLSNPNDMKMKFYLLGQTEQALYFTVLNRGHVLSEKDVVNQFYAVTLGNIFGTYSSDYLYGATQTTDNFLASVVIPKDMKSFDDLTTDSAIPEAANDECASGEEYTYTKNNSSSSSGGGFFGGVSWSSLFGDGPLGFLTKPSSGTTQPSVHPLPLGGGRLPSSHIKQFVSADQIKQAEHATLPDMGCDAGYDDPISDMLCDFGFDDIYFKEGSPKVIFDADHGYLHMSAELVLCLIGDTSCQRPEFETLPSKIFNRSKINVPSPGPVQVQKNKITNKSNLVAPVVFKH